MMLGQSWFFSPPPLFSNSIFHPLIQNWIVPTVYCYNCSLFHISYVFNCYYLTTWQNKSRTYIGTQTQTTRQLRKKKRVGKSSLPESLYISYIKDVLFFSHPFFFFHFPTLTACDRTDANTTNMNTHISTLYDLCRCTKTLLS